MFLAQKILCSKLFIYVLLLIILLDAFNYRDYL